MEAIWVEKYRPTSLKEVVGQDAVVGMLQGLVKARNLPHLLFSGPAGTGKTSCAVAVARELFGKEWRVNFHELNASDERGIDVIRTKVKEFARTAPLGDVGFKVIFLDEADHLTDDAQAAFRRTMEQYSHITRFVLSCNYSSRIIEPIQSRCAVFRFRPLRDEDVARIVKRVAKEEGLKLEEDGLAAVLYVARGDSRRAINTLQMAAGLGKGIDEDAVYEVTSTARPEEVRAMLEKALKGEFLKAREALDDLLVSYGLSGEDVVRQIHRAIFDLAVPDAAKVELLDRIGEADFRLVEGANERVQVEALLAHFALVGQGLGAGKKR